MKVLLHSLFNTFINYIFTFYSYMLYFFKFIRLQFFIFSRKIKKIFGITYSSALSSLNLSHNEFLDCLFVGSLFLLFFRFAFRLFLLSNPFWYFNVFVYVVGLLIQKKYNILKYVRKGFVEMCKIGLGKNYWYSFSIQEIIKFQQEFGLNTPLPVININNKNTFNKVFQKFFIFFILVRLWILKSPYKFIFLNFLFNLFLIFNKFFLLSSICSIFFMLSRLTLFASDYNTQDFYSVIGNIENINLKTDFIKPNWKNATIISFLIIRNFSFFNLSMFSGTTNGFSVFFDKYIQVEPSFKIYCNKVKLEGFSVYCYMRNIQNTYFIESNGCKGAQYKNILEINRKKKSFFSFLLCGGLFTPIPNGQNKIWDFLHNSFTFFKFTTKPRPAFPNEFTKLSEIAKAHPDIYIYIKGLLLGVGNKSTLKFKPTNTFFSNFPEKENENLITSSYTGRSFLRVFTIQTLQKIEDKSLDAHIDNLHSKGEIEAVIPAKSFLIHCIPETLPDFILNSDALVNLYKHISTNFYAGLVVPDAVNCMLTYVNPLATKQQAEEGLSSAIEYFSLMLLKKIPPEQTFMYTVILNDVKACYIDLKNIPDEFFSQTPLLFIEKKTLVLQELLVDLKSSNKPPFICMKKTFERIFPDDGPDVALRHINNLNRIDKSQGGMNKDHMVFKHITNNLIPPAAPIVTQNGTKVNLNNIKNINNVQYSNSNQTLGVVTKSTHPLGEFDP